MKQRQAFSVATQVRLLAEQLPNQAALRTCLLQEPDAAKRRKLYDFMKPFLRFASEFPSTLDTESRIILP